MEEHTTLDYDRIEVALLALKQRAKDHDNFGLSVAERLFYTGKAVVCLLLNRQKKYRNSGSPGDPSDVDGIAVFNAEPAVGYCPSNASHWEELSVGYGVFRNWYYDIYSDSSY